MEQLDERTMVKFPGYRFGEKTIHLNLTDWNQYIGISKDSTKIVHIIPASSWDTYWIIIISPEHIYINIDPIEKDNVRPLLISKDILSDTMYWKNAYTESLHILNPYAALNEEKYKDSLFYVKMGYIYFIQGNVTDPIKIGFTQGNVNTRLKSLQTGHATKLHVLRTIQGSTKNEKELHEKFRHLNTHGEWFSPKQDLLDFIDNPLVENPSRLQTVMAGIISKYNNKYL